MTPEQDFTKCVNALHLEIPQSVWNDVHFKWVAVRQSIGEDKARIAELEKEKKALNNMVDDALAKLIESRKEVERLKEDIHYNVKKAIEEILNPKK